VNAEVGVAVEVVVAVLDVADVGLAVLQLQCAALRLVDHLLPTTIDYMQKRNAIIKAILPSTHSNPVFAYFPSHRHAGKHFREI
jgi:hypothetical protein